MSSVYPLHVEREIHKRWLHRLAPIDRPTTLDRPKHPNDIRPLPRRSNDVTDRIQKTEPSEKDHGQGIRVVGGKADV